MKKIPTIVAGVALAVAAVAFAQPFGGMGSGLGSGMGSGYGHGMGMGAGSGPGMGAGYGHGMGWGHGPGAGFDPAVMADSYLNGLKAQLQITAAQEPVWKTFSEAMTQQAAGMQAMFAQMQRQDVAATPERMALYASVMQQRGAAMATMSNAFGALYAVLTPAQRAVADQQYGMMGSGGMHFGPRGG